MTSRPADVKHAGPADVIAYVWYELGYQPSGSLVLVALSGPRNRLGAIVRVDLPPRYARHAVLGPYVRGLIRTVSAAEPDSVFALVCSDEALSRPEPAVVSVLLKQLRKAGIGVHDAVGVGPAGYRSLLCDDLECCPPNGHPLTDVLASATAAAQVVAGRSFGADEYATIADVEPAADDDEEDWLSQLIEEQEWAEHELEDIQPWPDEFDELVEETLGDPEDLADESALAAFRWNWWCWFRDEIAAPVTDPVPYGPSRAPVRAPAFARSLSDRILRDVVLLHSMGASAGECELLLKAEAGASVFSGELSSWAAAMSLAVQNPPSQSHVEAATEVLATGARHAPAGLRAPVLSALAWLAWYEGNGGRARLLVERALEDRPGYSLALLVDEALLQAMPPPWVLAARAEQRRARRQAQHGATE